MTRTLIAIAFAAASWFCTSLALQTANADVGADAGPPAVHPDAGPEQTWHFTTYLKGTTAQVRKQLNGEVERLMAKTKATEKAIADDKAAIEAEEKASVERLHQSEPYQKLKADLKASEAERDTARKSGDSQGRLSASARCNRLRASIEQMDNDALAKNTALVEDRGSLHEQTIALKRHQESLEKARKWRDTLLEAIRTSARLKWPLQPGNMGVLGKVTPVQIVDAHSMVIQYEAYEEVGKSGQTEEIQNIDVIPHRVKMIVTGIDTKGMQEKQPITLDKTFTVDKTAEDGKYVVSKTAPSNIDQFFDTVVPLRNVPDEQ